VSNGTIALSYGHSAAQVGDVATLTCGSGYVLSGSGYNQVTCGTNGSWSQTIGTCISNTTAPATCSNLSVPYRGTISIAHYPARVGDTATLSCGSYVLTGNATAECQSGGTWSQSLGNCGACNPLSMGASSNNVLTYSNGQW
jgi:hypothetical protein